MSVWVGLGGSVGAFMVGVKRVAIGGICVRGRWWCKEGDKKKRFVWVEDDAEIKGQVRVYAWRRVCSEEEKRFLCMGGSGFNRGN